MIRTAFALLALSCGVAYATELPIPRKHPVGISVTMKREHIPAPKFDPRLTLPRHDERPQIDRPAGIP